MLYMQNWPIDKKKKKQKTNLFHICEQDHKTDNTAVNCSKFANKEKSAVNFNRNNNALLTI